MEWINKYSSRIAIWSVVIGVVWLLIGPILLTQFSIVDFAGEENNTGLIGDTIGGITTPFITLISVVLLFLALVKQIESNKINEHEANFRIVNEAIDKLNSDCEKYKFPLANQQFALGQEAILQYITDIGDRHLAAELTIYDYKTLVEFEVFTFKFGKIVYLLDNLKTSVEYKDILSKDLQNTFNLFFRRGRVNMVGLWTNIEYTDDVVLRKMHIIKEKFRIIDEDIARHNPR